MSVFLLTCVYALPHSGLRMTLWDKLKLLAGRINLPWAVWGDFNDILTPNERIGGAGVSHGRINWFQNRTQECNLVDLGASGPKFTWKGPRIRGFSRLFERLDRVFANLALIAQFPNCSVKNLPRTRFSDHNPILLNLGVLVKVRRNNPFRFEAMWMAHDDFNNFLRGQWNSDGGLEMKLENVRKGIPVWNKETFGMIERKKREILARLNGIQKSPAYPYSTFLNDLELKLQWELEEISKLEEIKWFQKSRAEWIVKSDRNTRYYHMKTKIRRRRNRVVSLQDELGVWVEDEVEVRDMVVKHFKRLFQDDLHHQVKLRTESNFPSIEVTRLEDIAKTPTDKEILEAIKRMGPYKAPGVDGFPPIFFQKNWEVVGADMCAFVKSAFSGEGDIANANKTLISLIPKVEHPLRVEHFRPISLCTVQYKCITKIISQRLRGVMEDLISPFQSSFIPGRHIQDNIVVGQEILHKMKLAKGKRGIMTMKIDLEKAYDRLEWSFLKMVLEEAGFEERFRNLIMTCVSSSSLNILWNGEKSEFFQPRRGLRQGDPISPFLFVLCMDRLSHIIDDLVRAKKWKPVMITKDGPAISHLMFADDLLLFGEASEEQATCMMEAIHNFCEASGEKVSISKSSLFFSPRVSTVLKGRIKNITGMKIASEIGKYLGFPLTRNKSSRDTFQYVIDRVKSKLATWKSSCLSMGGRITLAKTVISAIPLYPMQVSQLPVSVCKELERLQRRFIWGFSDSTKGFHPMSWERITLPKHYGGLGLKRLCSVNRAFGAKLAWSLVKGEDGLWAEVLKKKYMLRDEESLLNSKNSDSTLWKFICRQEEVVEAGSRWQVRNGESVSFFTDIWLFKSETIEKKCKRLLTAEEKGSTVADWVLSGFWDLSRLGEIVTEEVIRNLIAVLPPREEAGMDMMVWKGTSHGCFSVKSAYYMLEKPPDQLYNCDFKKIWAWRGAEKIRVFLWLAYNNRLPTNEWRSRWAANSRMCQFCENGIEDEMHIFRDCRYANQIWVELVHPRYITEFYSYSRQEWFSFNLTEDLSRDSNGRWNLIWGVGIWFLWIWRNNQVFNDEFQKPPCPTGVISRSWKLFSEFPELQSDPGGIQDSTIKRWIPPPDGWIKLNTDGAVSVENRKAGCGGVVRDNKGRWISGFIQYIGCCEVIESEEWALLYGLKQVWEEGFRRVVVESDAKLLIDKLMQGRTDPNSSNVYLQIKEMLCQKWEIILQYVPREANALADALAKEGLSISSLLNVCPDNLRAVLLNDCMGLDPLLGFSNI
ncbi:hypothetical protein QN277_003122 [Acacia crassicarpa]|uniref:Non-LTR retroelement reverse transcriptase n=1 Tax=Acacia crassicarpa TaxID=499986 RepID=A0AAE1NC64_9FABA|nr:hypothetical protein QN277_003122 [Acacia crassicarpa]